MHLISRKLSKRQKIKANFDALVNILNFLRVFPRFALNHEQNHFNAHDDQLHEAHKTHAQKQAHGAAYIGDEQRDVHYLLLSDLHVRQRLVVNIQRQYGIIQIDTAYKRQLRIVLGLIAFEWTQRQTMLV